MSNHSLSYALNDVITALKQENFFRALSREEKYRFIMKLHQIGGQYDYNMGEMLEGHPDLCICYYCEQMRDVDSDCLCEECGGDETEIAENKLLFSKSGNWTARKLKADENLNQNSSCVESKTAKAVAKIKQMLLLR